MNRAADLKQRKIRHALDNAAALLMADITGDRTGAERMLRGMLDTEPPAAAFVEGVNTTQALALFGVCVEGHAGRAITYESQVTDKARDVLVSLGIATIANPAIALGFTPETVYELMPVLACMVAEAARRVRPDNPGYLLTRIHERLRAVDFAL